MEITFNGGTQYTVRQRGHEIAVDIPKSLNGTDTGMMSSELLGAALGTCMGFYAVLYLRRNGIDPTGLRVEEDHDLDLEGDYKRVGGIRVKIIAPAHVSEADFAGMAQHAKNCMIHNTLCNPPPIELEILSESALAVDG